MPRFTRNLEATTDVPRPDLTRELVQELKENRSFGQPLIEEFVLPRTDRLKITVVWDRWEGVPDGVRVKVILNAYNQAESQAFVSRIALPMGLTVFEALHDNVLPFQIVTMLRKSDPVTMDQCREVMLEEGASVLGNPSMPQLAFFDAKGAEACIQRLVKRLPGSEPVWSIVHDEA